MRPVNTEVAASTVIHARGLGCVYGRGRRQVRALVDLDLDVQPGEVIGLLGPNGSGKSTTLRAVLGLLPPAQGTLQVFGGAAGRREARARTGYVPEEARRFGRLTGRETVDLFAQLQGCGGVVPVARASRRRSRMSVLRVGPLTVVSGPTREAWRVALPWLQPGSIALRCLCWMSPPAAWTPLVARTSCR